MSQRRADELLRADAAGDRRRAVPVVDQRGVVGVAGEPEPRAARSVDHFEVAVGIDPVAQARRRPHHRSQEGVHPALVEGRGRAGEHLLQPEAEIFTERRHAGRPGTASGAGRVVL